MVTSIREYCIIIIITIRETVPPRPQGQREDVPENNGGVRKYISCLWA